MKYYFLKTLFNVTFEKAIEKVTKELKNEGFDILSKIDIKSSLDQNFDVDFNEYQILNAIHPLLINKALRADINIGTIMPWNVVVYEHNDGMVTISIVKPLTSVFVVSNNEINTVAKQIQNKFKNVINNL